MCKLKGGAEGTKMQAMHDHQLKDEVIRKNEQEWVGEGVSK